MLAVFAGAAKISTAAAQSPKMSTIGVLVVESPASRRFWRLFREDLRQLGYVEGKNIRFEFRSDEGQASRLPALARELVDLKVDLIVALARKLIIALWRFVTTGETLEGVILRPAG